MHPADGVADRASSRPILVASDIYRSYGTRRALRALSFTLASGRVLGFLGPNGAGKTTAIRVLTTVLEPTSGRFEVDGIGSEEPIRIRRRIGVLPEGLGFPRHTSGAEYLTYYGQLFGRRQADARQVSRELLGQKPIVREVPIERIHHPIPIRPGRTKLIALIPITVRVPRPIEPGNRHPFAEPFRCQ